MTAAQKIAQYLGEAKATEDALVRVLQSQIAVTPRGSYRSALDAHLDETRSHSRQLAQRIRALGGGRDPVRLLLDLSEEVLGQSIALAKAPLDLLRGSGGEEKVLKNAKDAAASEALEIATYTAIERLAESTGDDETRRLAQAIRADEERMLARIMREIPALTDAVADAQLRDDPSYDVTRTGAADAVRDAGDELQDVAARAGDASLRTARKVPGVAEAEGQIEGAFADEEDLAISDYDGLTVDEINARLPGLTQLQLARIDAYERGHEDRTTVLDRLERLRGDEPWSGYDELNVSEIQKALSDRDEDQIAQVRTYERAHKNRTSVIRATERHRAQA